MHFFSSSLSPCTRLAGGKFELTNQDSAGGKNFTVLLTLTMQERHWHRQLFSLEMALTMHEKGLTISKTIPDCKKLKIGSIYF